MKDQTWGLLEEIFSQDPGLRAEPVSAEEISAAEAALGMALSDDYKQFVRRYGGAMVGPFPVFGLRKAEPMAKTDGSFLDVTKSFRGQRWPGVEKWAVIPVDHAGNPVGLDAQGKVWISDHDSRVVQEIASGFEGYVRYCLALGGRGDLSE